MQKETIFLHSPRLVSTGPPAKKNITEYNHGLGNGDNIHELEHGKWRKEPTHKRWNAPAYHHQNTRLSSSSDQNWRTPQHSNHTVMRNQNRDWRPHHSNERQTDLHHWRPLRSENARQGDSREQWRRPPKHRDTCTWRDPLENECIFIEGIFSILKTVILSIILCKFRKD